VSEHIWPKFCRAIDREEWIDDERYATFSDRVENRAELDPVLDEMFAERTTDEWMTILKAEDVPCTPVRDVETLVNDPHIETRGMIAEMEHPDLGTLKSPANPVNFGSLETDAESPPPRLGEHTREVLAELGYSEEELERLQENGVI
jgi:formyl-CoA transferase